MNFENAVDIETYLQQNRHHVLNLENKKILFSQIETKVEGCLKGQQNYADRMNTELEVAVTKIKVF